MSTPKRLLALALILAANATNAGAAEIRDAAGLFGDAAKSQAQKTLERAEKAYGVPVVIETVSSIGNLNISEAAQGRARGEKIAGVFVLIAKDEHKLDVVDHHELLGTAGRRKAIEMAFVNELKKRNFDGALEQGSQAIASELADARPRAAVRVVPPGGAVVRRGGGSGMGFFLTIGLIVLAVLIGVRLLGALFGGGARSAGGYGAPGRPGFGPGGGYGGGGGGGFFSGLMGGIGGAMAGNWLYDQMSGRRHDSGYTGSDVGGGTANDPGVSEYGDAGGADWGGDAGGGGGGGDWGGDAGGGGGGGDWGGGGGGGGDWS